MLFNTISVCHTQFPYCYVFFLSLWICTIYWGIHHGIMYIGYIWYTSELKMIFQRSFLVRKLKWAEKRTDWCIRLYIIHMSAFRYNAFGSFYSRINFGGWNFTLIQHFILSFRSHSQIAFYDNTYAYLLILHVCAEQCFAESVCATWNKKSALLPFTYENGWQ